MPFQNAVFMPCFGSFYGHRDLRPEFILKWKDEGAGFHSITF